MRKAINIFLLAIISIFILTACNNSGDSKTSEKELELQKRELDLKQKELELKEKELSQQGKVVTESEEKPKLNNDKVTPIAAKSAEVTYKKFKTSFFSVDLPSSFVTTSDNYETSSEYCDYTVKTKKGTQIIQIHSVTNSRFETTDAKELYETALSKSKLAIGYKTQKDNWFVISGTDKETGKKIYWKRVSGNIYISDLRIDYSSGQIANIEPYIGKIAGSFIGN